MEQEERCWESIHTSRSRELPRGDRVYKTALGAEVLFVQAVGESPMSNMGPASNIMHCTIKVGESRIMMCDDPRPGTAGDGGNISLAIGLNDPERAKRAVRESRQGRHGDHAAREDLLGGSIRDGDRSLRRQVDDQLRPAQVNL